MTITRSYMDLDLPINQLIMLIKESNFRASLKFLRHLF